MKGMLCNSANMAVLMTCELFFHSYVIPPVVEHGHDTMLTTKQEPHYVTIALIHHIMY